MFDYLIDHARKNVWCTPDQDSQVIISPVRITHPNGIKNKLTQQWSHITLPTNGERYHVYQIGQIHPSILNLLDVRNTWTSVANTCNNKNAIVDVYVGNGVQLPRTYTYYIVTDTNDVLIAIKKNAKINFSFDNDRIYLRFYNNSYFNSDRSSIPDDKIIVDGKHILTTTDILTIQNEVVQKRLLPGTTYCFVNGYVQNDISLVTASIGDYVEYVYDSSVYKVVSIPVSGLKTFDSVLDNKGKYLLHYSSPTDVIEYYDDVDLFIKHSSGKAVYVHKNMADTIRMLTHKDYSVVVSYINSYFEHFKINGVIPVSDLSIVLHIRKSGYNRLLILENNNINELYKLPDNLIVDAMLGVNANVPVWRAENLEKCNYVSLMSDSFMGITKQEVVSVYGYDGVVKQIGNVNQLTYLEGGFKKVNVPLLMQYSYTAYEYDSLGKLLGWHSVPLGGQIYICANVLCQHVELITGEGSDRLDEYYSNNVTPIDSKHSVRIYECNIVNNVPTNIFKEHTDSVTTNKIIVTRSDKKFLSLDLNLDYFEGVLEFPISYYQDRNNFVNPSNMLIPLGELDVFLNGYSLIPNLDYYFNGVKITIVNKSYAVSGNQNVTIRFTGFCNSDMKPNNDNEFGFVINNKLSNNRYFNIRDGKVQRVIIDGLVKLLPSNKYYEESATNGYFQDNGKPYYVRDFVLPTKMFTDVDSYELFNSSRAVDKTVTDYLTLKINQNVQSGLNPITNKHILYSPFLSRVIHELIDGRIDESLINQRYTNEQVITICEPFKYLLASDPLGQTVQQFNDYTTVHAHPFSNQIVLNFNHYKFLSKVVEIYGCGLIELSSHVQLV